MPIKPPFSLEDKRATVRTKDSKGRDKVATGTAQDMWAQYVLAPIACGFTTSAEIRITPGKRAWRLVEMTSDEALSELRRIPEAKALIKDVESIRQRRNPDELPAAPPARFRCKYQTQGRGCEQTAEDGWTTCIFHHWAGTDRAVFLAAQAGTKPEAPPSVPTRRLRCTFQPKAWIKDKPVDVDPWGETTWEITHMGRLPQRNSHESDDLRDHPAAPEWVREWGGPFSVDYEVIK